jgi:Ca-activated chloride channel family protein
MRRFTALLSLALVFISCVQTRQAEEVDAGKDEGVVGGIPAPAVPPPPALTRADAKHGYLTKNAAFEMESTESYAAIRESGWVAALTERKSTFSIDVDRASYSNVRRFINSGQLPPVDAVRIEELINYFPYADREPDGGAPFAVTSDVASCPWNRDHRLLRIGVRGRSIPEWERKPNNLVFLLDVSGSMASPDKLPLVKTAFRMLIDQLRGDDTVAIVVYAGAAGLVLEPTPGSDKDLIHDAIERLEAGGSTAGGEGILLAYKTAREHFNARGNNRVILATDGDFNVGVSSEQDLQQLIEEQRSHGVFLTVLGFGRGNLQDSKMELLADKGNGNYAYVDSELEARKVFVEELGGTLFTIAKDVKLQVDFDPARVARYRLIGYENRILATEDFDDDTKDAGELGSGHTVTALYELEPVRDARGEIARLSLRYKEPQQDSSRLIETRIVDSGKDFESASADLRFAAAVASYGMLLRNSEHRGTATFEDVIALARTSQGPDEAGYRAEFIRMVEKTGQLPTRVAVSE